MAELLRCAVCRGLGRIERARIPAAEGDDPVWSYCAVCAGRGKLSKRRLDAFRCWSEDELDDD
jgi:DnaJ-class molecular chaperone